MKLDLPKISFSVLSVIVKPLLGLTRDWRRQILYDQFYKLGTRIRETENKTDDKVLSALIPDLDTIQDGLRDGLNGESHPTPLVGVVPIVHEEDLESLVGRDEISLRELGLDETMAVSSETLVQGDEDDLEPIT